VLHPTIAPPGEHETAYFGVDPGQYFAGCSLDVRAGTVRGIAGTRESIARDR